MSVVRLNQLKTHPAQMRTTHDPDALATLTLQLYERGLDAWQPIVAAANGEGYHIVSGHRRHMAQLFALALQDWVQDNPDEAVTIETARNVLAEQTAASGSLETAVRDLLARYGDVEIPFVPFTGSQKAQILALHAANYGGEKPDALGVAHSFRQAVAAGAAPEEIARNVGQHANYVRNHLALAEMPPELAQRIAAGDLPMSVAAAVASVPEPKRTGLTRFILANEPGRLTAKAIRECATTLKQWPGLQLPLMVKHQSQRNIARALVTLWKQVVEAYPEDAWAAAAMLIYRHVHDEPWRSQEKLTLWFQALGGDTYFIDGRIHWTAVVAYLLTEVSCETCPIGQLPRQPLRTDLSQGQGGPLGMPCRIGQQASRCLHGLAPNDSFDVRVPWEWSEHPGVVNQEGAYRVRGYDDLLAAWQAQAAREQIEEEAAEPDSDSAEPAQTVAASPQATSPSPVARQRTRIAAFMQQHEQMTASHPFATPCGSCRHRLDSSPTKDDSVPHCAWAGRLRNVTFTVLTAEGENGRQVPVCRQFAPSQPWHDLIPPHPEPPGMPRDWLNAQILQLVKAANRHGSDRSAFAFLTGRPMGSNENYSGWFQEQLAAQSGELSDAQMFTLFIWAHTEWQRAQGKTFSLPVNGQGMQFVTVAERPWRMEEESA